MHKRLYINIMLVYVKNESPYKFGMQAASENHSLENTQQQWYDGVGQEFLKDEVIIEIFSS